MHYRWQTLLEELPPLSIWSQWIIENNRLSLSYNKFCRKFRINIQHPATWVCNHFRWKKKCYNLYLKLSLYCYWHQIRRKNFNCFKNLGEKYNFAIVTKISGSPWQKPKVFILNVTPSTLLLYFFKFSSLLSLKIKIFVYRQINARSSVGQLFCKISMTLKLVHQWFWFFKILEIFSF